MSASNLSAKRWLQLRVFTFISAWLKTSRLYEDNFSNTPRAWKGTDLRSCSVKWDWVQVSALWFTLPSAQDIPTSCCLCPSAVLQCWWVLYHPWEKGPLMLHEAPASSYFHTSVWLPCLPSLLSFLVYLMNSSQAFLFHSRGSENSSFFQRSLFAPSLQHMHFTCIPLFLCLTTLCFPRFFTRALISSLSKDFTCHALFLISLTGSQLLGKSCLFSLFWSETKSVAFYPEISPEYYSWSDAAACICCAGTLSQADNAETGKFLLFHLASLMGRSKTLTVWQKWK